MRSKSTNPKQIGGATLVRRLFSVLALSEVSVDLYSVSGVLTNPHFYVGGFGIRLLLSAQLFSSLPICRFGSVVESVQSFFFDSAFDSDVPPAGGSALHHPPFAWVKSHFIPYFDLSIATHQTK